MMVTEPTRRAMLGALATVSALPMIAAPAFAGTTDLEQELCRIEDWDKRLTKFGASDSEIQKWSQAQNKVLSQIEALPNTPKNAAIRAKAVAHLYRDMSVFEDENTTDYRLVRQIITALSQA